MIETTQTQNPAIEQRKTLTYVKNERMGGKVPVWKIEPYTPSAKETASQTLETAGQEKQPSAFASALSESSYNETSQSPDESFGFGDLVDFINPLHHIPLVGPIYRSITGDEIKPIAKLVGGGVIGGPISMATNLADIVLEKETGKSAIDHAARGIQAIRNTETSSFKQSEVALNQALQTDHDMARTLLSFADTSHNETGIMIERISAADARTAGSVHKYSAYTPDEKQVGTSREPITEITMQKMPPKRTSFNLNS